MCFANYEGFRISLAIILKHTFRSGFIVNNSGYKFIVASPYYYLKIHILYMYLTFALFLTLIKTH